MNASFRVFVIAGLDPAIYPSNDADGKLRILMEASTSDESYRDWRDAVHRRLLQIYCITIEDAGIDEGYLVCHWQSNEAPFEFVEWYGNKYDLDPMASLART
jgi:hypothetical protein